MLVRLRLLVVLAGAAALACAGDDGPSGGGGGPPPGDAGDGDGTGSSDPGDDGETGDGGTGGGTGGGEIPLDEAARALAEVKCKWMFECDCNGGRSEYGSEYECSEISRMLDEEAFQRFVDAGLQYDGACAAQMIADMDARGCDVEPPPACNAGCRLFHGAEAAGAACESQTVWSNCAPDLLCYSASSTCVDPCQLEQELNPGAPCVDANNVSLGVCPDGTFCDDTLTCAPLTPPGSLCTANNCEDGYWCELDQGGSGFCQPLQPDGTQCQSSIQCTGNCVTGMCQAKPGDGEACLDLTNPCADGLECYQDTCTSPVPSACWA